MISWISLKILLSGSTPFLVYLVSPVFFHHPRFIDRSLKQLVRRKIEENSLRAINIGSGNTNISPHILNVDFMNYSHVNIICDIQNLPFRDDSLDCVINVAVLEHLEHPEKVVEEIKRVLRPGGIVYSYFPFIQGIHASPSDFSRRTDEGLKLLFHQFEIIKIKPSGGPVSGFLWIFQEFISLLLSFGIKPLYRLIHILIMLLTFPLKYLDAVLIFHPMAANISTGFTLIAKKL
jgi:SAM-dependent methyltransferase